MNVAQINFVGRIDNSYITNCVHFLGGVVVKISGLCGCEAVRALR